MLSIQMIGFAEEVQTPGLSVTDCFCNKVNTPGSGHYTGTGGQAGAHWVILSALT